MSPTEMIATAIRMTDERIARAPEYPVYQSIKRQLEYLARVLEATEKDRSRLKDVMVGTYALREFEQSDPEYADLLFKVQRIADKMAKGLKVQ